MKRAETKFAALKQQDKWKGLTPEQEKIIALTAEVERIKHQSGAFLGKYKGKGPPAKQLNHNNKSESKAKKGHNKKGGKFQSKRPERSQDA